MLIYCDLLYITPGNGSIEIRRVFVHPGFKFPSLYDDIAVAELGKNKRIY